MYMQNMKDPAKHRSRSPRKKEIEVAAVEADKVIEAALSPRLSP